MTKHGGFSTGFAFSCLYPRTTFPYEKRTSVELGWSLCAHPKLMEVISVARLLQCK